MGLPLVRMRIVAYHSENSVASIVDALDLSTYASPRFRYFNENKHTWHWDYNLLNLNFSDKTFWPVGEDLHMSVLYPADTPACERVYYAHPHRGIWFRFAELGIRDSELMHGDTPYSAFTVKFPLSAAEVHANQDMGYDPSEPHNPTWHYVPTNRGAWRARNSNDVRFRFRFAPTYPTLVRA